jgi:hypothetical protein
MNSVLQVLVRLLSLLVNLPTLTGGLLLRRLWKSALLCSLLIAGIGAIDWLLKRAIQHAAFADNSDEFSPWLFYLHASYLLAIGVLVLYTCAKCLCAQNPTAAPLALKLAACTASILAIVVTYRVFPEARSYAEIDLRQGGMGINHSQNQAELEQERLRSLHRDIYLKAPRLWGKPSLVTWPGASKVSGIVRFQGQPAQVTVKLFLDEHWRTGFYQTNKQGEFAIPLLADNWEINRIQLGKWLNKPAGTGEYFVRLRSPELPSEQPIFNTAHYSERVHIDTRQPRTGYDLEIDIYPQIDLLWPALNEQTQMANVNQDSITWEPLKGAVSYKVELSEYGKDRHSGQRVFTIQVESNRLPLQGVPTQATDATKEYYIEITAYDAKGSMLSSSKDAFGKMYMRMAGREVIPDPESISTCHKPGD